MSDLHEDPSWQREAKNVAHKLDHNDLQGAQESMRRDLWQLQNDPRAQHEFINMVSNFDRKGAGADMLISRAQDGKEFWQILPPNYNDARYPVPVPPPVPMPAPEVVVVEPQRPSAGEKFVEGIVTGAGVGIGLGIMNRVFNGGHRHR
ncbi:MAG: hypothetical protein K2X27_26890 [Candidatus Obscuribacterales bacterium]|nr:hypothetical protein [Candidatus Obscuribacterales bacterium]